MNVSSSEDTGPAWVAAAAMWGWRWLSADPSTMGAGLVVMLLMAYVCGMWRFDRFSAKDLPRLPARPFLGNMAPFLFKKHTFTQLLQVQYKALIGRPYGGIFCFLRPAFLLRDPRLVRRVLQAEAGDFRRRRPLPGALPRHPLLDHGLDLMTDSSWKLTRSSLEKALDLVNLEPALKEVVACSRRLAVRLERLCHNQAVRVDLREPLGRFFSDACARTLLGHAADALRTQRDAFFTHTTQLTDPPALVHRLARLCSSVCPYQNFKLPMILPKTEEYFCKLGHLAVADVVVEEQLEKDRKKESDGKLPENTELRTVEQISHTNDETGSNGGEERLLETEKHKNVGELLHEIPVEEGTIQNAEIKDQEDDHGLDLEWRRTSVLHQMLRLQRSSDCKDDAKLDDIVSTLVAVTAEGARRSTELLALSLYLLSQNPEAQLRAVQEATAVQKTHGELSPQALKEMIFLDCVLKETLRLYPPAPLLHRICERRGSFLCTGSGPPVALRPGDDLWIAACALHCDPQYWIEPTAFRPERFLESSTQSITPFTFVPFGAGPRACMGSDLALAQSKMALATLLSRFDFRPSEPAPKQTPWRYLSEVRGGVWVTVQKRDLSCVQTDENTP